MAETYGRLTGRAGVCSATLGPGAINLLLGTADATTNSTPLVALSAQVGMRRSYKESHQSVDLVPMFEPVTKWSALMATPGAAPEMIRKAFKLAETERPGAVYLAVPGGRRGGRRTRRARPTAGQYPAGRRPVPGPGRARRGDPARGPQPDPAGRSRRGPGRSRSPALRRFAEALDIPVATTFHGKGVFPDDHPLALGAVGFMRHDYVNFGFDRGGRDRGGRVRAAGVRSRCGSTRRATRRSFTSTASRPRWTRTMTSRSGLHSDIGRSLDVLADTVGTESGVDRRRGRADPRPAAAPSSSGVQGDDRFPLAPARIVADTRAALRSRATSSSSTQGR